MSLATRLVHEGLGVRVIHPAHAHHCATALRKRAKTDVMDAQTLAQLAMLFQPAPWTPPPQIYDALPQRRAQRDDLRNRRQQVRHQLHALVQHPEVIAEVRARLDTWLATCEAQRTEVERAIATARTQDAAWAAAATRLQSMKGVGWGTAAWTLVATRNLTSCDTVDALTADAGLAPMPRQSGSRVWHRPAMGHTGNGRRRTALYMATVSAAQHNPVLKAFSTRVREVGKPEKVARCAAARKLRHITWAVVKKDQQFDPYYTRGSTNCLTGQYRIFASLRPIMRSRRSITGTRRGGSKELCNFSDSLVVEAPHSGFAQKRT